MRGARAVPAAAAAAAAVALVAVLAGCTSAKPAPQPSTPSALSTTAAPGTVAGTARQYGGPVGPGGGQSLNGDPAPRTAVAVRRGTTTVATTTTDALGRFEFRLPPGAYTLACGTEVPFALATGQTLNLDCPIPVR